MLDRRPESPPPFLRPLHSALGTIDGIDVVTVKRRRRRTLTKREVAEICASMRMLAEEDRARGFLADRRRYCDACERAVPAAGFVQYERYAICNHCAMEYEVASARGWANSVGCFVRDKNFGETGRYVLDSILRD